VAEAHFAVALAGYNTGLSDLEIVAASTREIDRALELKPGWEPAVLVKADILAKSSPENAVRYLNAFLAEAPASGAASARWRRSTSTRSASARHGRYSSGSSTPIRRTASCNSRWLRFRCR